LLMPKLDGIEATRQISAQQPQVHVLVLTSFVGDDKIFPAIKAGAVGYLLKDSEPSELIRSIHMVHRGELSLHPIIARKIMQEIQDQDRVVFRADVLQQVQHLVTRERPGQTHAAQRLLHLCRLPAHALDQRIRRDPFASGDRLEGTSGGQGRKQFRDPLALAAVGFDQSQPAGLTGTLQGMKRKLGEGVHVRQGSAVNRRCKGEV